MFLLNFFITISLITLLLIVNRHAIPLDIRIVNKLIPIRLSVIEIGVVLIITIEPKQFSNVVNNSCFLNLFFDFKFLS